MDTRLQGAILEEEVLEDLKKIDPDTTKTINSGALRGDGDIHTSEFCIDTKHKALASSFIATAQEMKESIKQGRKSGLEPLLIVKNRDRKKAAVMPYNTFIYMLQRIEQLEKELAFMKHAEASHIDY